MQIPYLLLYTCRDGKKKHAPHSALSSASNIMSIAFPPRSERAREKYVGRPRAEVELFLSE